MSLRISSTVMTLLGLMAIGRASAGNTINGSLYQLVLQGDQVATDYRATTFHAQNTSTLKGCLAWATSKKEFVSILYRLVPTLGVLLLHAPLTLGEKTCYWRFD
jgi:hypothetical protein